MGEAEAEEVRRQLVEEEQRLVVVVVAVVLGRGPIGQVEVVASDSSRSSSGALAVAPNNNNLSSRKGSGTPSDFGIRPRSLSVVVREAQLLVQKQVSSRGSVSVAASVGTRRRTAVRW